MSVYDIESHFSVPDKKVDDLVFVSDISYSKKYIEDEHKSRINDCDYTGAAEYLKSQDGITPYNADLFNLIANRTRKLQEELKEKYDEKDRVIYINEEPSVVSQHWISDN